MPNTPEERAHPAKASQIAYNRVHILTRNTIKRFFGSLKRRFPFLSLDLRLNVNASLYLIVACGVLHNICKMQNDKLDELKSVAQQEGQLREQQEDVNRRIRPGNAENFAVRNAIIATHFKQAVKELAAEPPPVLYNSPNDIWTEIAECYNSQCENNPRSVKQLKVFYDNAKRNTRKDAASQHQTNYEELIVARKMQLKTKKELNKTGGGSAACSMTASQEILLAEFINTEPLENHFDSADDYFSINHKNESEENVEVEVIPAPKEFSSTGITSVPRSASTSRSAPKVLNRRRPKKTILQLKRRFYEEKIKSCNFRQKNKKLQYKNLLNGN
ncbi:hypothetical protein ABEB36_004618 [Hypothenemus hampei]|uniref:Regulatory protein zeste n=1 Tax=Hypothenemus hampei TaxID=57062 RepID=A0ABD1F3Y2_HYPHA